MLQAPTSEAKTETTQSRSQFMPMPKRKLHPHAFGATEAYALNGTGSAASIRSPEAQKRQRLTGMQSTHGNQAVLRMLQSPQQAARMSLLRPSQGLMLQRKCACGGSSEPAGECAECQAKREGALQRRVANQGASPAANAVPPIVHDVLRSRGQPLDAGTRAFMEPRFGNDFSHVRVHTDTRAEESARAVNALAYTVGMDVVFGAGQYKPGTSEGRRLMAHELTHVVQQGVKNVQTPLKIGQVDDPYEREADTTARAVVSGSTERSFLMRVTLGGVPLQRQTTLNDDLDQMNVEQEEDEASDGDTLVVGISTDQDKDAQSTPEDMTLVQTDENEASDMVVEPVNSGGQDIIMTQANAKPKAPVKKAPPKPPKKITRIDVDLAKQTLTLIWNDKTTTGPRDISSGRGLPNTPNDPCKTQTEENCTPEGDFTITSRGDANTKNSKGDKMSWYIGFIGGRGIGIHDSQPVPGIPHSHGCVRVGDQAADDAFAKQINQNVIVGSTSVHVFGKAPTKPWKKSVTKKK